MSLRTVGFRFRFRASHRGVSLGLGLRRGPHRQCGFVSGAVGGNAARVSRQRSETTPKAGLLAMAAGLSHDSTGVPPTELFTRPMGTPSF